MSHDESVTTWLALALGVSLRAVERKLGIIPDMWRGEHGDE